MDDEDKTRAQLLDEVRQLRRTAEATQEQWRLFSLATTNLLWNWSFADGTVERNFGFETAFGYRREEIVPDIDWWVDRLHPDDRPRVLAVFARARDAGAQRCGYEYRFRRRDGSFAHISDNVFLLYEDGQAVRALGAMTDISERIEMERALRNSEERFRRAFGSQVPQRATDEPSGRVFVDVEDALRLSAAIVANLDEGIMLARREDGLIAFTNPRFDEMFGYAPGELVGKPATIVSARPAEAAENSRRAIETLRREGRWRGDVHALTKDGRAFWCHTTVSMLETTEFSSVHLASFTDITEQKRAIEHQKLITEELDHRVKNNLASIIGLASQTARRADSIDAFVGPFTARLHAMARVHEALASEGWHDLDLAELVDETVRLHAGETHQVSTSGPECRLSSAEASALGPALHELATNATKYGALSVPTGRIEIRWQVDDDGGLVVGWVERDGPPTPEDWEEGFGLQLVRGMIEHELGGRVAFELCCEGACHELRLRGAAP